MQPSKTLSKYSTFVSAPPKWRATRATRARARHSQAATRTDTKRSTLATGSADGRHDRLNGLAASVESYINNSAAPGTVTVSRTALRHFNLFAASTAGRVPFVLPESHADRAALLHNEETMMLFAAYLTSESTRAASTVLAYCSLLRSYVCTKHGIQIPTDTARWRKFAKALKRQHPTQRRACRALRVAHLRAAHHGVWRAGSAAHANEWALVCCGLHALARPMELAHLTRAHLSFQTGEPPCAVIWITPLKKAPGQGPVPILIAPGDESGADAYAACVRLVCVDPVHPSERHRTPLFRQANGRPFTRTSITALIRAVARAAGEGGDALAFSGRSMRIGGATELAAMGASQLTIKLMGRWDSNAYRAYTRVSRGQALSLSAAFSRAAPIDPSLEAAFPGFVQAPP